MEKEITVEVEDNNIHIGEDGASGLHYKNREDFIAWALTIADKLWPKDNG